MSNSYRPRRVFTLHGFAASFARDLRERGIEAWALSEENQMEFTLTQTSCRPFRWRIAAPNAARERSCPATIRISRVCRMLVKRSLQLQPNWKKFGLLADYLRGLTSEQLPIVTPYFTGKAFAQSDPRTLQIGWAVIFRALQAATKISDAEFHRVASSSRGCGQNRVRSSRWKNDTATVHLRESERLVRKSPPCARSDCQGRAAAKSILQNCLRAKVSTSSRFSLAICASDCARVWSRRRSRKHSASRSSR